MVKTLLFFSYDLNFHLEKYGKLLYVAYGGC